MNPPSAEAPRPAWFRQRTKRQRPRGVKREDGTNLGRVVQRREAQGRRSLVDPDTQLGHQEANGSVLRRDGRPVQRLRAQSIHGCGASLKERGEGGGKR